jgi:surface protein
VLFVVGMVFPFVVAPSFAVFNTASAFDQDVSKWNTAAVTRMDNSKCTASPSFCGHAPVDNLEFHWITILTRFDIFVFVRYCCWWWIGLSFPCCMLSFAVFERASVFNQNLSKWNTSAVTDLQSSMCTLSLSLTTPSAAVYFEYF